MHSLRLNVVPFALLLELCGDPSDDSDPATDPDVSIPEEVDAGARPTDASAIERPDATAAPDAASAANAASATPDAGVLRAPPGLYADDSCDSLAPGVRPYSPRFDLWADGAEKERFVFIPHGATIDASDPDLWRYPVGMRLYKTFSAGELKLETRVMEKTKAGHGPDAWTFQVYAWLPDQDGVELVAGGRADVLGTPHNIPSLAQCRSCHSAAGQDAVNSFSAIQLNHPRAGVSLAMLLDEGSLASPLGPGLLDLAVVPGDACAQPALGYLHANCGNCHGGPTPRAAMTLRLRVGQTELETAAVYLSTVAQPLQFWTTGVQESGDPIVLRIAPGSAAASGIIARMSARGSRDQMPPIGTELTDPAGIAAVSTWIDSL